MKKATLFSDGGSRGNPGPAGIGYVLTLEDGAVLKRGEYIGEATNNVAEYMALKRGIELALNEGVTHLSCFLDSELVVKQLRGEYRIKNGGLKPLFDKVRTAAGRLAEISYTHVLRAKNKEADRLVNMALDKKASLVL